MSTLSTLFGERRNLFQSRPFRMSMLYAGVFAALSALSLGLMFALYLQEARLETHTELSAEAKALTLAYESAGLEAAIAYAESLRGELRGERWRFEFLTPEGSRSIPAQPGRQVTAERDRVKRQVRLGPELVATLEISTYDQRQATRLLGRGLATGVIGLVVLALVGGILLAWLTNRRVTRMDRALEDIMRGQLDSRLPVREHGDELDRLAGNVNSALDRVQQLMETVKTATDGIAHDLRTPLARHRARLERAQAHPPGPDALQGFIEASLTEVDRILATFRGLLQLATVETGNLRSSFQPLDLSSVVAEWVELYEPLAAERGILLQARLSGSAKVDGRRDLLGQSVANLLDNAIKFSPPDSEVEVTLERDAQSLQLCVADRGPGIPASERERVFQRLYRLDSSRNTPGLGLGLSLVRAVVDLHGGRISIEDHAPGTRIRVWLPASLSPAEPSAVRSSDRSAGPGAVRTTGTPLQRSLPSP